MSAAPHSASPPPAASLSPVAAWLAGWTSLHTAWLLFSPPAFMVGVRWILQLLTDRQGGVPALALVPVGTTTGVADLLWPVLLVLVLLAAGVWGLRRLGLRRALIVLGALWVALGLAGSAALLQGHLNRQGLFFQPPGAAAPSPVVVSVLASQFKSANLHSLGGTELVLKVPGLPIPQRLLINDPQAASLAPGDALALHLVPGRFSGLFVTGWRRAASAEAALPSASASASASEPASAIPDAASLPASAASH